MTKHKKPNDARNTVEPPPVHHHTWIEPPPLEPSEVLAQNVGPKAAPPDGWTPPPSPGQSGETYGFKEAGRYVGEAAGKVVGSEFGPNGQWAGGELGKHIGEGVGELLDWAAGPVPPPVEPPPPDQGAGMSLPSGASINADDLPGGMSQAPAGYSSAGSHLDPGACVEPNMSVDPGITPAVDPSHLPPEAGGMSTDPGMSINPNMSTDPG